MFSLEREHALRNSDALLKSFTSAPSGDLRHTISLDDDGWVKVTVNDETRLLFWVPVHYRRRLTFDGGISLNHSGPIHLDLQKFVHGTNWSRCSASAPRAEQ